MKAGMLQLDDTNLTSKNDDNSSRVYSIANPFPNERLLGVLCRSASQATERRKTAYFTCSVNLEQARDLHVLNQALDVADELLQHDMPPTTNIKSTIDNVFDKLGLGSISASNIMNRYNSGHANEFIPFLKKLKNDWNENKNKKPSDLGNGFRGYCHARVVGIPIMKYEGLFKGLSSCSEKEVKPYIDYLNRKVIYDPCAEIHIVVDRSRRPDLCDGVADSIDVTFQVNELNKLLTDTHHANSVIPNPMVQKWLSNGSVWPLAVDKCQWNDKEKDSAFRWRIIKGQLWQVPVFVYKNENGWKGWDRREAGSVDAVASGVRFVLKLHQRDPNSVSASFELLRSIHLLVSCKVGGRYNYHHYANHNQKKFSPPGCIRNADVTIRIFCQKEGISSWSFRSKMMAGSDSNMSHLDKAIHGVDGCNHSYVSVKTCPPKDVSENLEAAFRAYNSAIDPSSNDADKKLRTILTLVQTIEFIHPFLDGNCRTCYCLLQYLLLQNGFDLVILEDPNCIEYQNIEELVETIKAGMKTCQELTPEPWFLGFFSQYPKKTELNKYPSRTDSKELDSWLIKAVMLENKAGPLPHFNAYPDNWLIGLLSCLADRNDIIANHAPLIKGIYNHLVHHADAARSEENKKEIRKILTKGGLQENKCSTESLSSEEVLRSLIRQDGNAGIIASNTAHLGGTAAPGTPAASGIFAPTPSTVKKQSPDGVAITTPPAAATATTHKESEITRFDSAVDFRNYLFDMDYNPSVIVDALDSIFSDDIMLDKVFKNPTELKNTLSCIFTTKRAALSESDKADLIDHTNTLLTKNALFTNRMFGPERSFSCSLRLKEMFPALRM